MGNAMCGIDKCNASQQTPVSFMDDDRYFSLNSTKLHVSTENTPRKQKMDIMGVAYEYALADIKLFISWFKKT